MLNKDLDFPNLFYNEGMKLINQNDYPNVEYLTNLHYEDRNHNTTILSSGCGICCALMILNYFYPEMKVSLQDMIEEAYKAHANYSAGTNFYRFAPVFCEDYHLSFSNTESKEELFHHLDQGNIALVNVGGDYDDHIGILSHGGHYILVMSHQGNTLEILDPGLEPNKYLEKERKEKVTVKGEYVYCDVQVLIDDIQNRLPHPIFLFSKNS